MGSEFWSALGACFLFVAAFVAIVAGLAFAVDWVLTWWSRRKNKAYEYVPPWEPTGQSDDDRRYAGEVLPHQRQLTLALYRHLMGDLKVDTRLFGYRQQKPGTGEWESVQMGDQVFPLQQDLCTAIRRLGWDRMVESVLPQLLLHMNSRSAETQEGSGRSWNPDYVERCAKDAYEAHYDAIGKLVAENSAIKSDSMALVYDIGLKSTPKPAIRAFTPKYE